MTIVRIEDCRALRLCTTGVRRFCRATGVDFERLVREGVPAEELPDDYQAQRVIDAAAKREERENGQQ